MGENSSIEWTDHSFNPWIGCCKVSKGCRNCYAERLFGDEPRWSDCWGPVSETRRKRTSEGNWRKPIAWDRVAQRTGRPALVFCASMADVFESHPDVGPWRVQLFGLIERTPSLRWLLLTKRPALAAVFYARHPELVSDNVWMGVSAENQECADERIAILAETPASKRFVSYEPVLGPVTLDTTHLDWVIVGCESGPHRRPMHLDWVRDVRDQCKDAGIPLFVKQLPVKGRASKYPAVWPGDLRIREEPDREQTGQLSLFGMQTENLQGVQR